MSTRATVHFEYNGKAEAIVYRHSDGYPKGLGKDLEAFFDVLETDVDDPRFSDPCYLAAKWVVHDSARYIRNLSDGTPKHRLEFLGVGVVLEDPGDIEYRYHVQCNGGRPTVRCQPVR